MRIVDIECSAVTEVIGRRAFTSREDIQEFLDSIPTIDVAPLVVKQQQLVHKISEDTKSTEAVASHWVMVPTDRIINEPDRVHWKCSSCGKETDLPNYEKANFCFNCGVKMIQE